MVSDLITVYCETDGSNTTGTFSIKSTSFTNTPEYIQIDKHLKLKIWARRIAGAAATVFVQYTDDVTASTPTWQNIDVIHLAADGELDLEKRKPVIVVGRTGKEAIRFTWSQSTAAKTYVVFDIEVEPIK